MSSALVAFFAVDAVEAAGGLVVVRLLPTFEDGRPMEAGGILGRASLSPDDAVTVASRIIEASAEADRQLFKCTPHFHDLVANPVVRLELIRDGHCVLCGEFLKGGRA